VSLGLTPVFAGLPVVAGRAPSPDEGMSGRQGERCYRKEELGSRIRHPTAGALKAEAPWVWGSEDLAEAGMWNPETPHPRVNPTDTRIDPRPRAFGYRTSPRARPGPRSCTLSIYTGLLAPAGGHDDAPVCVWPVPRTPTAPCRSPARHQVTG